jgi:hypothetical protein
VSEWILLLHPFVQTSVQRRQFLSCRIYNGQSLSSRIFLPKYEHDCGLSCWDLLSYSLHRVHLVCFGSVLPSEFSGFLAMSVELQLPEHIDSDRVQFDQLLPGFFNIRVQMSCRIILLLAFLNADIFHWLLLPCRLYCECAMRSWFVLRHHYHDRYLCSRELLPIRLHLHESMPCRERV